MRPLRGGPATSTCSPSGTVSGAGASEMEVDADDQLGLAVRTAPPGREVGGVDVDGKHADRVRTVDRASNRRRRRARSSPAAPRARSTRRRSGRVRCAGTAAAGTPASAASAGSSRRKTQRSPQAASIDGGISPWPLGRQRRRRCRARRPRRRSASAARARSAPVGPSSAPRSAGTPSMASTTCGRSPRPPRAASRVELAHQPAQQAGEPLPLVRAHDGAAVRQPGEVVQAVIAAGVDRVDVEPGRRTFPRDRRDDRPQRGRRARRRDHRGGRGDRRRAASARAGGTARRGRRRCPRRRARARDRHRRRGRPARAAAGSHGRWGGAMSDSAAA